MRVPWERVQFRITAEELREKDNVKTAEALRG